MLLLLLLLLILLLVDVKSRHNQDTETKTRFSSFESVSLKLEFSWKSAHIMYILKRPRRKLSERSKPKVLKFGGLDRD